jgi:hypothetical protein
MFGPPLAFILGMVALFKDESKAYAIAALVISTPTALLWWLPVLCR